MRVLAVNPGLAPCALHLSPRPAGLKILTTEPSTFPGLASDLLSPEPGLGTICVEPRAATRRRRGASPGSLATSPIESRPAGRHEDCDDSPGWSHPHRFNRRARIGQHARDRRSTKFEVRNPSRAPGLATRACILRSLLPILQPPPGCDPVDGPCLAGRQQEYLAVAKFATQIEKRSRRRFCLKKDI